MPDWIFVCSSGRWQGYIENNLLSSVPVQNWDQFILKSYLKDLDELPSINENEPLWRGVLEIEKNNSNRILVKSHAGLPVGTLDRINIGESVLKKIGLKIPKEFIDSARKNNIYPLGLDLINVIESMISSGIIDNYLD